MRSINISYFSSYSTFYNFDMNIELCQYLGKKKWRFIVTVRLVYFAVQDCKKEYSRIGI